MSDESKKAGEFLCLQKVIEAGRRTRGKTKRIISMLDGEDLLRFDDERPDFVRIPYSNTNIVIGIEHFRVDHFSLQKADGKVASKAAPHEKSRDSVYEKWHQHLVDTGDVPVKALHDVMDLVANRFKFQKEATYNNFIKSFRYSLYKHTKNIDVYRKNIGKTSSKKIEIALLIEVHTEFCDLFLNDKRGTRKASSGIMPMFADIVRLIEAIDYRKVNYIVLCLCSEANGNTIEVQAFQPKDMRSQLDRQHIKVFEYAGDDCLLHDFQSSHKDISVKPTVIQSNESFDVSLEYSRKDLTDELVLDFVHYAAKRAYYALQNQFPYATTLRVQIFMEVFGDYILGWEDVPNDIDGWRVRPILAHFDKSIIEQGFNDFAQRWGIKG